MKTNGYLIAYALIAGGGATLSLYLYLLAEYYASVGVIVIIILLSLPALRK